MFLIGLDRFVEDASKATSMTMQKDCASRRPLAQWAHSIMELPVWNVLKEDQTAMIVFPNKYSNQDSRSVSFSHGTWPSNRRELGEPISTTSLACLATTTSTLPTTPVFRPLEWRTVHSAAAIAILQLVQSSARPATTCLIWTPQLECANSIVKRRDYSAAKHVTLLISIKPNSNASSVSQDTSSTLKYNNANLFPLVHSALSSI